MDITNKFFEANKELWNNVTDEHVKNNFDNLNAFLKEGTTLDSIELKLSGDIKNKTILQLHAEKKAD